MSHSIVPDVREDLLRIVVGDRTAIFEAVLRVLRVHHAQQSRGPYASPPSEGVLRARACAAASILPEDREALAVELAVEHYYHLLNSVRSHAA